MSSADARAAILGSVRASLARSREREAHRPELPVLHAPAQGPAIPAAARSAPEQPPRSALIEAFRARLQAVGGRCIPVPDRSGAAAALREILGGIAGRRIAVTDSALALSVTRSAAADLDLQLLQDPSRADLFDCDAGVTGAQWGIAETGTVVLEQHRERNRLASLIPPVHVALLPADRLCVDLGEALRRVRGDGPEVPARAITFITGPSRTADIELTLAMGVHGPQELYVVLIEQEDEP